MEIKERIIDHLTGELELKRFQIENTVILLEEGCTIPFMARYRKEKTGELDEVRLQAVRDRYRYLTELEERKATIIESIESQGKLTVELRKKILESMKKQELEDLYLPYRPKRRTRATIAKERGLEPLASMIRAYTKPDADLESLCEPYIDPEKGVNDIEDALKGARDILAEEAAENAEYRKFIRQVLAKDGMIVSRVKKKYREQSSKFEMYYDYTELFRTVPSHRYLAMRRGEKEGMLSLDLNGPDDRILEVMEKFWIRHPASYFTTQLKEAFKDGYQRLILPSITAEILVETKDIAGDEAILVFEKNLRELLLQPPGGQTITMGIDPGYRTGCKAAVVDGTGRFCENATIYLLGKSEYNRKAEAVLLPLIRKYDVDVIAIGNGTASRETHIFVKAMLKKNDLEGKIRLYVVNESGASVYSASELAREEFPDLDVTVRGAVSIARRFQDPLAELVKIDPKSIGVGQYQHDVNQRKLREKLNEVVQFVVNRIGVEVNSASFSLLEHVSGITSAIARNIVRHRYENGRFQSREELRKIPRLGERTFEQAAGFMRISGAQNPLDSSSVHPESYPVVERMAADLAVSVGELVENDPLIEKIDTGKYCTNEIGLPTLRDIVEELKKPGRDPRQELTSFEFDSDINEMSDLNEGMVLPGIVTNVTNFGAFVDIGVHQDGLVHISKMSRKFVRNPYDICSVGQKVKVKVMSIDAQRNRISLSMKDV